MSNSTKRSAFFEVSGRGILRLIKLASLAGLTLGPMLWTTAALYFDFPAPSLRLPLAIAYIIAIIVSWILIRNAILRFVAWTGSFLLVLGWWLTLQPSNERNWQRDVAILPQAVIDENKVTIQNIRNCLYRTERDFDVRHYDKTFRLDELRTVDIHFVTWGSPLIAHTMVSFGFEGGEYICISIEARKEKAEKHSAIRGFFRQFELTYVIADERDVVQLRTNYRRGEEVYLYRVQMSSEEKRRLFLSYLERANELARRPQWYNALTSNCTTNIRLHSDLAGERRSPFDWRILLNGKGDELLYERHRIARSLPFAQLKERSHINARAQSANADAKFSEVIRSNLPEL